MKYLMNLTFLIMCIGTSSYGLADSNSNNDKIQVGNTPESFATAIQGVERNADNKIRCWQQGVQIYINDLNGKVSLKKEPQQIINSRNGQFVRFFNVGDAVCVID